MHSLTPKLFTAHIVAIVLWMENAQNLFGMLGALAGLLSGVMLVCIHWEKFVESKPARFLANILSRRRRRGRTS